MSAEVHAFDLVTGAPLGRLDVGQLSWSEQLNARMTIDCRLDLAHRPSREMVPLLVDDVHNCVRPVKLVLFDDPVVKSFILWEVQYIDRRFLKLSGAGLWSWFAQFPLSQRLRFVQAEQIYIATTLIGWAQAPEQGGGINVAVEWTPSGRKRDQTYEGFEYGMVGQRVDELAALADGFDFAIESTFDGNVTVTDTWRPSYPRAGRPWPASGIQIDADGTTTTLEVLTSQPTTDVRAIGAGEGTGMLHAEAHDDTLDAWPPLWADTGADHKTVERQATLQGHADRQLQLANRGTERWSVTVLDKYDLLKGLTVGDECQVVVGPGDFRYPDGLSVVRRVVGRSVTVPDDGGPDEVDLELEVSDV